MINGLIELSSYPSLILASASPRRKQLLSEAGYKFTVAEPGIDEFAFTTDGIAPCDYAKQLALAKAKSIAKKFPDSLVIGADTIVDLNGERIGKPADEKDAENIVTLTMDFEGPVNAMNTEFNKEYFSTIERLEKEHYKKHS